MPEDSSEALDNSEDESETQETDTQDTQPGDVPEEFCDYIYLLEHRPDPIQPCGHSSYLWQFNTTDDDLAQMGKVECPFNDISDYLIAMTADSKGLVWFLSNSERVFRADPATLNCVDMNIDAHSWSIGLHSRSLAYMRENPEAPRFVYVHVCQLWFVLL